MLRYILIFIVGGGNIILFGQAPAVNQGPGVWTPTPVVVDMGTQPSTVVYRDPTSIDLTAGFQVIQADNTNNPSNYFLGYINVPATANYAELEEVLDDAYYIAVNSLVGFKYEEKYNITSGKALNFTIYNAQNQVMAAPSITKQYGLNYLVLNLIGYNYVAGQYYLLVVTGEKGEKKYLRFKYVAI